MYVCVHVCIYACLQNALHDASSCKYACLGACMWYVLDASQCVCAMCFCSVYYIMLCMQVSVYVVSALRKYACACMWCGMCLMPVVQVCMHLCVCGVWSMHACGRTWYVM
jgi:hypothetical protein